ncbi:MAG TPA: hypothetical protein PKE27_12370 [Povalibacter sp.]|uniref:hypothetical protein n=1 Tax=Povalibacter sp. TaxID=1962978 RepID=UPI002C2D96B9|nr:hypothetical protein [Povalibacter sp.]HMN45368.1 hypothetical protein [Povalibacter sp.]
MRRPWIVLFGLLLCPFVAGACESNDRHRCRQLIGQLIAYRSEAIEYAFGSVFDVLPDNVEIKFVSSSDPQYAKFSGRVAYDQAARMMIVPRRYLDAQTPNPLRWAAAYWPYYRNPQYQAAFPLIAAIDSALWGAVLQETAHGRGLSWPHAECSSVDLSKRLPCEMLIAGVGALLTDNRVEMFNANRIDRIWPDDFSSFQQRAWRTDREYVDVQRFGGVLLLRPLFSEFGVPSALAYVAQTPFRIEDGNMRVSALRYQERAREVLQGRPAILVSGEAHGEDPPPVSSRSRHFVSFGSRDGA